MLSFLRRVRVLIFGPSREMLEAEIAPPRQLLDDEQLASLREVVRTMRRNSEARSNN
jgi:hypothetical protein